MKRFYKTVSVGDDLSILLDGKPIKTPAGVRLTLPSRALADAIAEEWRGQGETIVPASTPLTRLADTATDHTPVAREMIKSELLGFGASDLLCYRATEPDVLAARQDAAWAPLLGWLFETSGARLKATRGITHIAQDKQALVALAHMLAPMDDWTLTGMQTLTSLTGSLVLALAMERNRLTPAQAFALSRIDEDFQAEKWGLDSEAETRARLHAAELETAGKFIALARA